jgi:hypothetical protein
LTIRLAELVERGIVARKRYSERPPRYHYVLTQAGLDLVPILAALTAWGDRWASGAGGPPGVFRHDRCGHRMTPRVSCSHCGKPVTSAEIQFLPGPGARSAPGTLLLRKFLSGRPTVPPSATPSTTSIRREPRRRGSVRQQELERAIKKG